MSVVSSTLNVPRKGENAIDSAASLVVRVVSPRTCHIDPSGSIESVRLPVCKVLFYICLCQSSHDALGRIADDKKRTAILIDKIAVVSAHFEREDGPVTRRQWFLSRSARLS